MNKKRYILTDSCYWYERKDNRPRSPHYVEVVDLATGTKKNLKSGSIISILKEVK